MTRWEYREAVWQPEQVIVTTPGYGNDTTTETYETADWYGLLARFGDEGWEMINCTGSPVGMHEYFFYFKRLVEE
jgi:hypothetical protein